MESREGVYIPKHNIRIVTATALFDGHDASINIIRRMLMNCGAEVIHLAHNRSADEIVAAAIEEDAHGIAISSYQGGHMEFFKYMVDLLKSRGASAIKVFGGGGGVIVRREIEELSDYGVARIFSPEDSSEMSLQGMANFILKALDHPLTLIPDLDISALSPENIHLTARLISAVEGKDSEMNPSLQRPIPDLLTPKNNDIPVLGITGTGGAGKSSLIDEIVHRFLRDSADITIAIIGCDPSRRKSGGALLGDRIRMNAISDDRVYMRSLAAGNSLGGIPKALGDIINVIKAAGYDLIIVETAGIGQGDTAIVDLTDIAVYVTTSEFGSAIQLEKIDMLDFADFIVVNKYDKTGGEDAVRAIRDLLRTNHTPTLSNESRTPVFGTISSRFNDDGVTALYISIVRELEKRKSLETSLNEEPTSVTTSTSRPAIVPAERTHYLSEISTTIRKYHQHTDEQAELARQLWHVDEVSKLVDSGTTVDSVREALEGRALDLLVNLDPDVKVEIERWRKESETYEKEELVFQSRHKEIRLALKTETLSGIKIPKIALPKFVDPGEIYKWARKENLPGEYPYTAGAFSLKRVDEEPTRMFAGEGDPARTNKRFKLLSESYTAKRLSTAFDPVTLYGYDPDIRPDIYGKIGTSGVSVCSLDDIKTLYDGFDLSAPTQSVSMTINGPAPILLAMFFNAAIDQRVEKVKAELARNLKPDEYEKIKKETLTRLRGTVQADILKEDQGQNTCVFSTDFSLKMMGDVQAFFIENQIRNFYSVSISGYHIAEAGANPVTQLAFTLANGFTYVEYFLARGMKIDDFAPNLSFFFSNGMDPEYTVLGRVARRIWAIAMKDKYGAAGRSSVLKYHIQTSGRSLQSQDIQFNDIRTTLQALCAVYDNCNSLHTNAYDEAITTPSEESVRRALAIQMIINQEWGVTLNENLLQGSFLVSELTDLVEEAVLKEFDNISRRGGVLGAMETGYQRGKIQEESLRYELARQSGARPIVGVNIFKGADTISNDTSGLQLSRATEAEKQSQLSRMNSFKQKNKSASPMALEELKQTALIGGNIFETLMETVKTCTLGQITNALFEVGGKYRRNM